MRARLFTEVKQWLAACTTFLCNLMFACSVFRSAAQSYPYDGVMVTLDVCIWWGDGDTQCFHMMGRWWFSMFSDDGDSWSFHMIGWWWWL